MPVYNGANSIGLGIFGDFCYKINTSGYRLDIWIVGPHAPLQNNIPVFCPGLTDGSLGDMLYFHSFKNPGLVVDIVQGTTLHITFHFSSPPRVAWICCVSDIRAMNGEAVHAGQRKTGMIILGGGLPKHHICNANMMRNGADYAVFINTAQEFDGSDSGARPDEAVSWGKIRGSAKTIKVRLFTIALFFFLV